MVKQAPTFGRLLTMVLFALSCFGLILFLWLSFGGPVPLQPKGYRVHVAFPEANQLGLEADVRVAGVRIGKVRQKEIGGKDHPNRTVATIEIEPRFAPIASDSRAILRQKTLLGETYVEMTRGTPAAKKIADNGWLADGKVAKTVELDEIFQALDPVTRQAFRTWQQDLGAGTKGRGHDINDAIGNLPRFAASADDVLTVLDAQSSAVRRLVRNTGVVFGAVSQNEGQLKRLITGGGKLFDATSSQQDALAETFKIFPTFLDESKATLARLQTFARDTDPLIQDLRPSARDLKPTLASVRRLSPNLLAFYRNLSPLIDVSKKGLPALRDILAGIKPVLGSTQPFLEQLNPILQWLEYHQRTVQDFISNGAAALADTIPTRTSDERGHMLRQFGPKGVQTVAMYPSRQLVPGHIARGNTYLNPSALSGPERAKRMIFPSFDCNSTADGKEYQTKASAEGTFDAPSCWVQPAPSYPPGNTRKFPHIEAADYSKPAR